MAESTLSLTLLDLKKTVADYMGVGLDDTAWSDNEVARITEYVKSGLRQFYSGILPGRADVHEWSFLRPNTTLEMVVDQTVYVLPDSYGGILGPFYFDSADSIGGAVMVGSVGDILWRESHNHLTSGRPQIAALRPKTSDGTGQRWEAVFWPNPDSEYTLHYRYQVLPDSIAADGQYPWGGSRHAETLKAACLAVAERMDRSGETIHQADYLTKLAGSIVIDGKMGAAETLGFMGPGHPGMGIIRRDHACGLGRVTYEGNLYDGVDA